MFYWLFIFRNGRKSRKSVIFHDRSMNLNNKFSLLFVYLKKLNRISNYNINFNYILNIINLELTLAITLDICRFFSRYKVINSVIMKKCTNH